ncbi:MAG: prepilin-type N-terminal cleavage/methylation domain-containing protein [Puniceicoccales bacterium]|jgi:prepilin-type N-terminal cleavage/methylation domain-containing protein|nr:prepilin-type N-terminal cleavage/methylation domain-containing protein [Puniceicoccales bacterium]
MRKNRKRIEAHQRCNGFTLLEVILALGLGGLILSTVMTLFVTFVQVWEENGDRKEFLEHVDYCTHFLSTHLNAITPLIGKEGGKGQSFTAGKVRSEGMGRDAAFGLTKQLGRPFLFLSSSCGPCSIALCNVGCQLILLWQERPLRQKRFGVGVEEDSTVVTHRCILSDCVKELQCGYLDLEKGTWSFKGWMDALRKSYDNQDKSLGKCPDGIRIVFNKNNYEEQRFIALLDAKMFQIQEPRSVKPNVKTAKNGNNNHVL